MAGPWPGAILQQGLLGCGERRETQSHRRALPACCVLRAVHAKSPQPPVGEDPLSRFAPRALAVEDRKRELWVEPLAGDLAHGGSCCTGAGAGRLLRGHGPLHRPLRGLIILPEKGRPRPLR
jgi:hypothetical protein